MIGLYFSGTGNTKYCIEKFMEQYDRTAKVISIEDKSALEEIKTSANIVFAAPVYYSNTPKIVRDFIDHHQDLFYQKIFF